jgi:predicted nucleic acid-binding protein
MRTYRRSDAGIGLGDYSVAAAAQIEGCELATLHIGHFPMAPGLKRRRR